jgi:NADH:ubiquinone oxidoreductase subunit E
VNELLNKYPEEIQKILSRYPADQKRSAVMPMLFLAQREFPYVSQQAIQEIAEILEISPRMSLQLSVFTRSSMKNPVDGIVSKSAPICPVHCVVLKNS